MRYITTSGVTRLKPLEYSGTSSEVIKELPRLILPETRVPAYIEEVPQAVLTVEQLRTMGSQLATMTEQERAVLDTVLDESPEGIELEQTAQMNAMAQLQNDMTPTMPQNEIIIPPSQGLQPVTEGVSIAEGSEIPLASTLTPTLAPTPTIGGMPPPNLSNNIIPGQRPLIENEGFINGPQVPGTGPVIAIRTDAEAMMADGIMPGGFGRAPRRASYRGFGGGMNMNQMMPAVSRYTPMEGGSAMPSSVSSGAPITITKLE
jgi:hypothetical protein